MRRRDLQIGLVKALGGGFDATQTGLVVPGDERGQAPAATPAAAAGASGTAATATATTAAAK